MTREASDATKLRNALSELREARALIADLRPLCDTLRIKLATITADRDEWKRRFDLLLERTPKVKQ